MNKKWVYPMLLTFLVFFVLSNPESAGPQTRSFFSWVGEQASSFQTFLDGVFDDDSPAGSTVTTPSTVNGGAPSGDSFNTLQPLRPAAPGRL